MHSCNMLMNSLLVCFFSSWTLAKIHVNACVADSQRWTHLIRSPISGDCKKKYVSELTELSYMIHVDIRENQLKNGYLSKNYNMAKINSSQDLFQVTSYYPCM